jgi:hypothetical protein
MIPQNLSLNLMGFLEMFVKLVQILEGELGNTSKRPSQS